MNYLWLLAALVVVVLLMIFWRQAGGPSKAAELPQRPPVTPPKAAATPADVQPPARQAAAEPVRPPEAPAELLAFRPVRAEDLPDDRRRALVATFQDVPRPPKLLQHLLSPDFLNAASSAQLVDLITAEPLIAAKLLAAVNSPMYALQRPATGVEQAVFYLGVNTVRAICLQYLLIAAFEPGDGERAKRLEATWRSSALASELTQHLCQALYLESPGSMVSGVVLSFLGQLAIQGTVSDDVLARLPGSGFLARTRAEQEALGLSAAEIGRLLMTDWGLPQAVIDDASDVDSVLTTPADPSHPDRDGRLALCYFCARVGERLADGSLGSLAGMNGLEIVDQQVADFFHFRGYLQHPWLRNLAEALKSPALAEKIDRMLAAPRQ